MRLSPLALALVQPAPSPAQDLSVGALYGRPLTGPVEYDGDRVRRVGYGLFCLAGDADAASTRDARMLQSSLLVPRVAGLSFGATARSLAEDEVIAEAWLLPPPGSGLSERRVSVPLAPGVSEGAIWRIDSPESLPLGVYTLVVTTPEAVLYQVRFTVISPDDWRGRLPRCAAAG